MDNVEAKVKELVTDFKLEEALDVLLAQAQTQNQRKQNALLVLKGKLALLEEQNLSGMLDPSDVARQKAAIAHQILDIADGSPLDHEIATPMADEPRVLVQKTVRVPNNGGGFGRYILIGGFLLAAVIGGFLFVKSCGSQPDKTEQTEPVEPSNTTDANTEEGQNETTQSSDSDSDELKVLDFPDYRKKYNFLDFQYEFQKVTAVTYSDSETKLTLRYFLHCRSNMGVCYRAVPRVIADGIEIGPTYQLSTDGWIAHDSTITDELSFVIPNNAKSYYFELLRDGSTWKRAFKILQ